MGIFDKFKKGFQKSASAFSSGLKEIIIKKEIDDENLNKIEEFLIQSDVGIEAATEIKGIISKKKVDPNKDLTEEINLILKEYIISLMKPLENNSFFMKKEKLNATLISGVNGVGKTTSIGKIGKILKNNGNKVMFAASDTFRAAAIEQLENWANKIDFQITKSSKGSDPCDDLIILTPILLAQFSNCSIAAALKVSEAANITLLPLVFKILPILPILVVLPTPFTPEIKVALSFSFFEKKELCSKGFINEIIYSFRIRFISDVKSLLGSTFFVEIISFISEAASIPTSD